ncbi:MAG: hypothetical protein P8Y64_01380 [Gammaproteobacteria bacterium]
MRPVPHLAAVVLLCWAGLAGAEPLAVGDPLPPLTLPDQHGHPHTVEPTTRIVMLSDSNEAGRLIQHFLHRQPEGFETRHHLVTIADIHDMPLIVRELFFYPTLSHAPHRVLIDGDGKATRLLPRRAGEVTVLHIHGGRIQAIDYARTLSTLQHLLAPAAASSADRDQSR